MMNVRSLGIQVAMAATVTVALGLYGAQFAQAASLTGKSFSMEGSAVLKDLGSDSWLLDFLPDQFAGSGDGRARVGSTSEIVGVPVGTEFYIKDLNLTKSGSEWKYLGGSLPWFSVQGIAFILEEFIMSQTSLGGYQASLGGFFQAEGSSYATDYGYFGSSKLMSSTFRAKGTTFQSDFIAGDAIPTPALLPGVIGMGVTMLRKRRQVASA